jgi:glyceraldehyde 3-phosphate dehydrogenase
MINVGINGFGRIGKCTFLQLLLNPNFNIKCINALEFEAKDIEDYLLYDTTHKHHIPINVEVIDEHNIRINRHTIVLFSDIDATKLQWKQYNCNYIIDATGAYLSQEKCSLHNCDYIVISSPPKDNTPTFIYGVNQDKYNGEKIVSGSSCTTNAISPLLKLLNDNSNIISCIFTTIHATTGTQNTVDTTNKTRTSRSIINNIIPHSTGATNSIIKVIPELENKIFGTSLRVPVINVSLVDVNIELEDKTITLNDIKNLIIKSNYYKQTVDFSEKNLVSSDFTSTNVPCILDLNASMELGNGKFKLMIWYDNEWSYSAQLIRLVQSMYNKNSCLNPLLNIHNIELSNKRVVCRFDYNVPIDETKNIIDDFRIKSTIETIIYILKQSPKCIYLVSHFGRPNGKDKLFSLDFLIPILEKYLNRQIIFIQNGLDHFTNKSDIDFDFDFDSNNDTDIPIFLLENIRYHTEEMNFTHISDDNIIYNNYKELGDVYIMDAFGCMHRNHMSICGIKDKPIGYGLLIDKEVTMINSLFDPHKSKLGIIGGNKIIDKIPIIKSLNKLKNTNIFIGGGLATHYESNLTNEFIMTDGYGENSLDLQPNYIADIKNTELNTYDIGDTSFYFLKQLIDKSDIIFWNGALGVIENEHYRKGSIKLIKYLQSCKDKTIIMGGGETASLINTMENNSNIFISTGGGALLEYIEQKMIQNDTLIGLKPFM